jgi:hypothetical protein
VTHPCACRSSDSAWLHLCDEHKAEFAALHKRAQREKDGAELLGCYYLVPDKSRDSPDQPKPE